MLDIDVDLKLLGILSLYFLTIIFFSRRVKILQGDFGLVFNSLLLALELRIHLYFGKGIAFVLGVLFLLKTVYRFLHQCDRFDLAMVLEVEKSPELSLNQFSLQLFVHGVDLLIAEDELIVA